MIGDFDDDTHFCLKCHSTIIGLDNYVNHRKSGCTKTVVDHPKSPLPSQLLPPDESFNLKADDFFSSLELQSSSKKPLSQSTSGKNFSGILTRSKTTAVIQASTSQKEEIPQSKSGKHVWIGGHQLKLGGGDNQSKLIKAVDNLEWRKEDPPKIGVYEDSDVESEDFDYDVEESSDEDSHDAPPRNHTGGKWKPSSPIQWSAPPPSYTGGKWKPTPPKSHTGGKWKPASPIQWGTSAPPPSYTGGKWKPVPKRATSPPASHTKGKWKPSDDTDDFEIPPPTFTGSKWSQSKAKEFEPPPTSHTKGKWKPDNNEDSVLTNKKQVKKNNSAVKNPDDSPLRKPSGTVQYWCRPCNRRLASKLVYERHLKSELHFKRTLHDKEFDDCPEFITPDKRVKTKIPPDLILEEQEERSTPAKRKRKKIYTRCEVCASKVNNSLIGKHLISHYHCRKGDISSEVARAMVLDNMWDVVLQSPFQCGLCRFYCNHQKDFVQHWLSDLHVVKQQNSQGYFWCSMCKFKCVNNGVMYDHLISPEHQEVISVINRSVPIVIKKINLMKCEECQEEFIFNIALVKHCQATGHKSLITDNFACVKCQQVFRSNISLKRHRMKVHSENIFICTVCNKNFSNKQDAKLHRNSTEHKHKLDVKTRNCDYCTETFTDLSALKTHLKTQHLKFCPRCLRCGATFTLAQELSVHLRTKSCVYAETSYNKSSNCCDKCQFSSESTSELLFHKVLHTEPLMVDSSADSSTKKAVAQYKCPLCQKFFPKASLQAHLRVHTKERPFVCGVCKKGFVRKNNWVLHVRNHAKKDEKSLKEKEKREACGERPFLCSTCGASFQKKSVLQQHMTTHSGKLCKCPKSGCIFSARSISELKQHFRIHSDVKSFACTICKYRGKTKQQLTRHLTIHSDTKKYTCTKCNFSARTMSHLKRHLRLHTGSKPYSCPHCTYKCNSLENLRKHVLSTNKHPGKCIYECKFCPDRRPFESNFAKDFKAHLITQHTEIFKTCSEAASYVTGIYEAQEDCTELPVSGSEDEAAEETDKSKPRVIILQQHVVLDQDPVVAASTSKDENDTNEDGNADEILPMFIVSKDREGADDMSETWDVVGSYDVEEFGALVPFNSDNVLFQGNF